MDGLLEHINGANIICEVLYSTGNPSIRTTTVSTGCYICAQPRQLLSLIPEQYAQILSNSAKRLTFLNDSQSMRMPETSREKGLYKPALLQSPTAPSFPQSMRAQQSLPHGTCLPSDCDPL